MGYRILCQLCRSEVLRITIHRQIVDQVLRKKSKYLAIAATLYGAFRECEQIGMRCAFVYTYRYKFSMSVGSKFHESIYRTLVLPPTPSIYLNGYLIRELKYGRINSFHLYNRFKNPKKPIKIYKFRDVMNSENCFKSRYHLDISNANCSRC